jgi:cyanophycinase
MKIKIAALLLSAFALLSISCKNNADSLKPKGQLYIIGGGKRPPEMVKQLIALSGAKSGKYIIVLPQSSSEPDTAAYWAMKQFKDQGVTNITYFNFKKNEIVEQSKLDSLENAGMIYIAGGDQSLFMGVVLNTPVYNAIHNAYKKGAVIAGTSAGAAVMSKKMITGNQLKHPEMEGYKTIQPNNIEITEGLGLVTTAIFDQHFIWRERINRLISVSIENPNELAIGIDESTALLVKGDSATVYGVSQVVVLNAANANTVATDSLLGVNGIELNVYLPGQRFLLTPRN